MSGTDQKAGRLKEEQLRRKSKWIRRREEEEDLEISGYYQKLEYMRENCPPCDREILGLLEEQQGMLNDLCMKKQEFFFFYLSCHMYYTMI